MAAQTTQKQGAQTTTHTAKVADFIYSPPVAAQGATRILVKPNLGYPKGPPVTVGMSVLSRVLQGLRQAAPQAEILVVEGVCSKLSLGEIAGKNGLYDILDEGMAVLDADRQRRAAYPHQNLRSQKRYCPTHQTLVPSPWAL
ncbi:MAG: DUF362 domain-containing protein, partial [Cyanobacteria bacterium J06649_12]